MPWWEGGVIYHIYVRSFSDSDSDGFGDIFGIIDRLSYLSDLGIDAIWLSPIMPSPNHDWGYDVSDYLDVMRDLGSLETLDILVQEADRLGIGVLLDLVPNHTSSGHPWFQDAIADRTSRYRDYYVFADPGPSGSAPNNWIDVTGKSAWTLDEGSGQYYLHNFLPTQPDLNWWNPKVHAEFDRILRFWFDRGIAGFRIDVAHGIYKDLYLRDDPPSQGLASQFDHLGLREVYSKNRPEVHELFRSWRMIADSYTPPRVLLGETWVSSLGQLGAFYGSSDQLNLALNFPFLLSRFSAEDLANMVDATLSALPADATPLWTASNHDLSRFPTRWANCQEAKIRLGLAVLATLPGTMILYYGDELGLCDYPVPTELLRDEMTMGASSETFLRDRARTPMLWDQSQNRGFTAPGVTPWLPILENSANDVASQMKSTTSILRLSIELIKLRKQHLPTRESFKEIALDRGVWSYQVAGLRVVANFTDDATSIRLDPCRYLSTERLWDVQEGSGDVKISPWSALIVDSTLP
ncbi:MAG: alpha-amylase family glycosyl hydrolase [Ferrimicrobium sp.]